jgi:hypothetical protein
VVAAGTYDWSVAHEGLMQVKDAEHEAKKDWQGCACRQRRIGRDVLAGKEGLAGMCLQAKKDWQGCACRQRRIGRDVLVGKEGRSCSENIAMVGW